MKIREVRLMEEAASDLEAGREFYDEHGVDVGDYFSDGILSDLGELRLYAGIHSIRHTWHRLLSRRFPYAIYYEFDDVEVRVVAILDMRRNPRWVTASLRVRRKRRE
jgi:plasmid stabilization system protein ParE